MNKKICPNCGEELEEEYPYYFCTYGCLAEFDLEDLGETRVTYSQEEVAKAKLTSGLFASQSEGDIEFKERLKSSSEAYKKVEAEYLAKRLALKATMTEEEWQAYLEAEAIENAKKFVGINERTWGDV